jgi:hypothetical protein
MADMNQFLQAYAVYKSTFKETSYDSEKKIYLCNDETQTVINFDKVIAEKYPDPQNSGRPKSFDAIYVFENRIYCIEFKNQKFSDIASSDIKEKFRCGREELNMLLEKEHVQKKAYEFIYCVCYKDCIEPRDRYKCGVAKGVALYGLADFEEQKIAKNVFTNSVTFFKKQLQKKMSQQLICR